MGALRPPEPADGPVRRAVRVDRTVAAGNVHRATDARRERGRRRRSLPRRRVDNSRHRLAGDWRYRQRHVDGAGRPSDLARGRVVDSRTSPARSRHRPGRGPPDLDCRTATPPTDLIHGKVHRNRLGRLPASLISVEKLLTELGHHLRIALHFCFLALHQPLSRVIYPRWYGAKSHVADRVLIRPRSALNARPERSDLRLSIWSFGGAGGARTRDQRIRKWPISPCPDYPQLFCAATD